MRDDLQITYQDQQLSNPHVATLEIANVGRNSISSNAFDGNRGLALGINAKVIKVLDTQQVPTSAPKPTIAAAGSGLELLPELIMPKEVITLSLLTEGRVEELTLKINPLVDVTVDVRDRELWLKQRTNKRLRATGVTLGILTALLVVDLVFSFRQRAAAEASLRSQEHSLHMLNQLSACSNFAIAVLADDSILKRAYNGITPHRNNRGLIRSISFASNYGGLQYEASLQAIVLTGVYNSMAGTGITDHTAYSAANTLSTLFHAIQKASDAGKAADYAKLSNAIRVLSNFRIPKQCSLRHRLS